MSTRVNISMADSFYNKLCEAAKNDGKTVSEYIRYCVTRYWDEKKV